MTAKRSARTPATPDPADGPGVSDAPTRSDRQRIQHGRREARLLCARADADRAARQSAALRIEIGAAVRSASPLLIALLATRGLTLDDAVALIQPALFWPRRSTKSGPPFGSTIRNTLWRYYMTTTPPHQARSSRHAHTFHDANGNYVRVQVVDHSLEVEAKIAPVWLETRFGELRIQLDDALPETLATACLGRLIDEIVDHAAWRGKGWRIVGVEKPVTRYFGQTLIVATGSVPYQVTWPETNQSQVSGP